MKVEGQPEETGTQDEHVFASFGDNEDGNFWESDVSPEDIQEKVKKAKPDVEGDQPKPKPKKEKELAEEDLDEENEFPEFADEEQDEEEPEKPVKKKTTKEKPAASEDDEEEEDDEDKKPAKGKKPKAADPKEDDEEDEDEDEDVEFFTSLTKDLKERGFFANSELEEDEKITEDRFFELQEEEIDSRVDETISSFMNELKGDPIASAMLKFVKDGGSAAQFLAKQIASPLLKFPADYNLEKEENQKKLIKFYETTINGESEEDADDTIELLGEKGKLAEKAERYHAKLVKKQEAEDAALIKSQADAKTKSIEKYNDNRQKLQKVVDSLDVENNFKFTPAIKKTLTDDITKPTIKVGENQYISKFQAEMKGILQDHKKLAVLASFVLSGMDTSIFTKEIKNQQISKVKSNLAKAGRGKTETLRGGQKESGKSLADFF